MKPLHLKALAGLTLLSASAIAYAVPTDTSFFLIGRLESSSGTSGGYRVYPADYALPTICQKSDFAQAEPSGGPLVGPNSIERDLMNRLLSSAFMARRKVKLRLEGCVGERPQFRIVTVDIDQ